MPDFQVRSRLAHTHTTPHNTPPHPATPTHLARPPHAHSHPCSQPPTPCLSSAACPLAHAHRPHRAVLYDHARPPFQPTHPTYVSHSPHIRTHTRAHTTFTIATNHPHNTHTSHLTRVMRYASQAIQPRGLTFKTLSIVLPHFQVYSFTTRTQHAPPSHSLTDTPPAPFFHYSRSNPARLHTHAHAYCMVTV